MRITEFTLNTPDFSLDHTLQAGQTFCWSKNKSHWDGFIHNQFCRLHQSGSTLFVRGAVTPEAVNLYFRLGPAWTTLLARLPDDPFLMQALREVPGLHCVREPWFECTANFICSSLKQIPQICRINLELRRRFGPKLTGCHHGFPEPSVIAGLEEKDLRACGLGFRARHLLAASRQIAGGSFQWEELQTKTTPEASDYLQHLQGVGEKVAHCILLYAAERFDAFPVDVWVQRLMQQLYFPKSRRPPHLNSINRKSLQLFGPLRGLAQQQLFHWYRTIYTKRTPPDLA